MICLVSPAPRANSYVVPFALLYLSAWLEKEGIPSNIIDIKKWTFRYALNKREIKEINLNVVQRLKLLQPDYIGITCFTYDYWSVLELAQLIKDHMKTKIIVGGIHPTIRPYDFLYEKSPFDYIIVGDGEIPLSDFLKMDKSNKSLYDIPGLGYRDKNGHYRVNENTTSADYSLMPPLPYEKIDMDFYTAPNTYIVRKLYASGIHIMTTKGCPFHCTFCANSSYKISYRPIKSIIDEIEILKKNYYIDSFYIQDDTFGIKRGRVIQFIDELKLRNLSLFWGMETRVNLLDEELVARLAKAGCIQIDFGVESGSQASLDRMRKGIKVEDTLTAFALCQKYKIRTLANVMFNTPEETEDDVKKTIKLIKEIKPTVLGIALTIPLLGTQICKDYVQPEINKSEYHLFANEDMYRVIQDKRFKLAKHNINLTKLRERLVYTYMFPREFVDYTFNPHYWKVLIFSKRKLQYLNRVVTDVITHHFWRIFSYIYRLYKRIGKQFY